ncbi:MAG: response regulator [Nitrospirae bacterium]|nr:response regulator [Nitrospirota bacterium]
MNKKTVLIAEKDNATRLLFEVYLRRNGYGVVKAMDGGDALNIVKNNKIDIVICNLYMLGIDGISITEIIRNKLGLDKIVLIIVDDEDDCEKMEHAIASGANEYIIKPVLESMLIEKIKEHTNGRSNRDTVVVS